MTELNISPSPAGIKKAMKITPVATIRSLTQAETAREMKESVRIHIAEHNSMGTTIHRWDHIHPPPANPACRLNKSKQGTQVMAESSKTGRRAFQEHSRSFRRGG